MPTLALQFGISNRLIVKSVSKENKHLIHHCRRIMRTKFRINETKVWNVMIHEVDSRPETVFFSQQKPIKKIFARCRFLLPSGRIFRSDWVTEFQFFPLHFTFFSLLLATQWTNRRRREKIGDGDELIELNQQDIGRSRVGCRLKEVW